QGAEIIETPLRLSGPARFDAGKMRRQLGVPIVLLDRDNGTFRLRQHSRFPAPLSDFTPSVLVSMVKAVSSRLECVRMRANHLSPCHARLAMTAEKRLLNDATGAPSCALSV